MIPTRNYVLLQTQTITANGTSGIVVLPGDYSAAIIAMTTASAGGTSPTLAVYIQECFRVPAATDTNDISTGTAPTNYTVFDDFLAFASATGNATQIARIVGGGNTVGALSDASMTTNSVKNGPLGQAWRVKWVVGGTSPSFSLSIYAKFIF